MISKKVTRLTAALLPFVLGGCALHIHRRESPPNGFRYEPPQVVSAIFVRNPAPAVSLGTVTETTADHEIVPLSFASSADDGGPPNVVEGFYFRSLRPGAKRLVVVMPIWGASDYPPAKISHGYAHRSGGDSHVIWISGNTPLFPWAELTAADTEAEFVTAARASAERYRAAVADMRRLLDWAETRPEIDAKRIGFVGFSMSALVTATLLGNDDRISAAVLMMGAANLADVFSACGDKAGTVREHAMQRFDWSLERYRAFFAELFGPADPINYAGHYDPREILMIDAMFDDCMPKSARTALWEVTGRPERITLLYQHRHAFYSLTPLGLNFARRRIYRFLDRTL